MRTCPCQDSRGVVCGVKLSKKAFDQDGMCADCADEVWAEMNCGIGADIHHPDFKQYTWTNTEWSDHA